MKYLRINQTKEIKDLCIVNYNYNLIIVFISGLKDMYKEFEDYIIKKANRENQKSIT